MAYHKLIKHVPEIYHSMLPEVFFCEVPPEPLCDCFNCPVTAENNQQLDDNLVRPFSLEDTALEYNYIDASKFMSLFEPIRIWFRI